MSDSQNPPESGEPTSGSTPPPPPPPPSTPPGYGQAPPPPTQPGYGQPPPPPAYGAPTPGGSRFGIGDAFNYGWLKFQQNAGQIILAALVLLVGVVIIEGIGFAITSGMGTATVQINEATGEMTTSGGGLFGAAFFVSMLFGFLAMALAMIVQAGIIKGALNITNGRKLAIREMFEGLNYANVLLTAILVALGTMIGTILCILPGIVFGFYSLFSMYFAIDKNLPAVDAIKASFSLVNKNVGSLVGLFIACAVAYFIGALLCLVGLLVAIPVVVIAQAYAYRTMQGEQVAA